MQNESKILLNFLQFQLWHEALQYRCKSMIWNSIKTLRVDKILKFISGERLVMFCRKILLGLEFGSKSNVPTDLFTKYFW